MAKQAHLLTEQEEQDVVKAIVRAEQETSGEIRVHIEPNCKGEPLQRAIDIFPKLGMHKTKHRNGVLIYIASEDHKLAIYGDKAIHEHVGQHFWDDVLSQMQNHFKTGTYGNGIAEAVLAVGDKLKTRFPHEADDKDELSDEISYDDPDK